MAKTFPKPPTQSFLGYGLGLDSESSPDKENIANFANSPFAKEVLWIEEAMLCQEFPEKRIDRKGLLNKLYDIAVMRNFESCILDLEALRNPIKPKFESFPFLEKEVEEILTWKLYCINFPEDAFISLQFEQNPYTNLSLIQCSVLKFC